jgi:hypothetical protein
MSPPLFPGGTLKTYLEQIYDEPLLLQLPRSETKNSGSTCHVAANQRGPIEITKMALQTGYDFFQKLDYKTHHVAAVVSSSCYPKFEIDTIHLCCVEVTMGKV